MALKLTCPRRVKSYHIKVHRGIMALFVKLAMVSPSYHIKVHRGIMAIQMSYHQL